MAHYSSKEISEHRHHHRHGWPKHYHCPKCGLDFPYREMVKSCRHGAASGDPGPAPKKR